jgi:putative sigma-54 modulation protein
MSRFKTKLQRKHKDHRDIDFSMVPEVEEVPKTEVIRKKTFDMIPMSQDEAIMQMELLSHNFFVFLNMETDSVAVVYKRKDGGYGLLEPSY